MANTISVNTGSGSTQFSRCTNGMTDTYMPSGVSAFDTNWYRSNNYNQDNTTASATITLNLDTQCLVYIDVLDYQNESTYDYGRLSVLDSSGSYKYDGNGNHISGGQTIEYGTVSAGTHYIYATYRKDTSVGNANDRFYFRVRLVPIRNLTGTTWVINNSPVLASKRYYINFTSNNTNYTSLYLYNSSSIRYYTSTYSQTTVYSGSWTNQNYRTITITGGTDVSNADLLVWLMANAIEQKLIQYSTSIGTAPAQKTVNDGYVLTSSDLPTLSATGYRFDGWYIDTTKINAGYIVSTNITLTARWTRIYTITYSSTYGTVPSSKTVDTGYRFVNADLVEPQNAPEDKRFVEWRNNGTAVHSGDTVTSDMTLTAYWVDRQRYTISYNSPYGTPPSGKTVLEGYALVPLDLPELSDPDIAIFHGWFHDSTFTNEANVGDEVDSNITLYANWYDAWYLTIYDEEHDNTIAFENPVGEISIRLWDASTFAAIVDNGEEPWISVKRPNEIFTGFDHINKVHDLPEYLIGSTFKVDDISGAGSAKRLYAIYQKSYTVSYVTAHGENPYSVGITNMTPIDEDYLPELYERGFIFGGWYYDPDYETSVNIGDFLDSDTVFFAKWIALEANYITYETEFGHVDTKDIFPNEVIDESYLPTLSKKTYRFDGWYYDDAYQNAVELGDEITEDVTFYAQWTWLNQYIVRFDTRGRVFPPSDQVVNANAKVTEPEDPLADGFIFKGWYTSLEYSELWDFANDRVNSNIVLYALWEKPLEYKDVDWTQSMKQTFEFYRVDAKTWYDAEKVLNIDSCSINRDLTVDTLGSGSFNCLDELPECYIRVYLVIEQNNRPYRVCLGTLLVQTPEFSFNGKRTQLTMDGYTSLIELKNSMPPIGYSIREGADIMQRAFKNTLEHCQAPVLEPGYEKTLYAHFLANPDDTWFTFINDLLANGDSHFIVDEYGVISFGINESINSATPVWTYSDDDRSILFQDIKDQRDLYNIPNVVEVVYSNGVSTFFSRVVNDDENSITSIQNRGREVVFRETNPSIPADMAGDNAQEYIDEYAEKLLYNKSQLEHTITYKHGYCPVKVGDGVIINYKAAGLINIKAKVISQTINCTTGCEVEETAVYTTNLWR